jgi:PAH dioxygenase small subunit
MTLVQSVGERLSSSDIRHCQIRDFYVDEAELLDNRLHREWLDLLSADITYRIPVRVTVRSGEPERSGRMMHMDEDIASLRYRVERLGTKTAWAEDPPSRTRRLVTNVRVSLVPGTDSRLHAASSLLLLRNRGDRSDYEILSAERRDEFVRSDDRWLLACREVTVDQANLGLVNMAQIL